MGGADPGIFFQKMLALLGPRLLPYLFPFYLIDVIVLFCKGYKIHDILVPIAGIGKHHPDAAGDWFLFFVVDRDELETAAVKRPVGSEEKADAKSIFYHLDRDIRVWDEMGGMEGFSKVILPPLVEQQFYHRI